MATTSSNAFHAANRQRRLPAGQAGKKIVKVASRIKSGKAEVSAVTAPRLRRCKVGPARHCAATASETVTSGMARWESVQDPARRGPSPDAPNAPHQQREQPAKRDFDQPASNCFHTAPHSAPGPARCAHDRGAAIVRSAGKSSPAPPARGRNDLHRRPGCANDDKNPSPARPSATHKVQIRSGRIGIRPRPCTRSAGANVMRHDQAGERPAARPRIGP